MHGVSGPVRVSADVISMDDRRHFATLILANQLGVLSIERVITSADQRILEIEKPEHWLIEVSMNGYSESLARSLIVPTTQFTARHFDWPSLHGWTDRFRTIDSCHAARHC